jgi:hypothetical protein
MLFMALWFGKDSAFAQAPTVSARLDSASFFIGRQITFALSAGMPANRSAVWPLIGDTLTEGVEVVKELKADTAFSADKSIVTVTRNYLITSFDSGYYRIPSLVFGFTDGKDTDRVFTESLFLRVNRPEVDTTADIRDIKGPAEIPFDWREYLPYMLSAAGIILLTALILFFIIRRLRHKTSEPEPAFTAEEIPIHEQVIARLNALKGRRLWESGMVKEYYTELTDILRFYIKGRFHIDATEMVSEDIILRVKYKGVSERHYGTLDVLLRESDLVKFAKAFPSGVQNEEALHTALRWISETADKTKPEESEEGGSHDH